MKYSLRSLLIVAILGPPLLAVAWFSLRHEEMRYLALVGAAIIPVHVVAICVYLLVLRLGNYRR